MTIRSKLTKSGKVRGRPVTAPLDDGFGAAAMARDLDRQLRTLDQKRVQKFGYRTDTEKIIDEVLLISAAEKRLSEEGRERTIQNIAIALIELSGATSADEIASLLPSVERWLRSSRKHHLRSALQSKRLDLP